MKEFFGYGRSRSGCDKGDIVKRHFNDYVNCIHTLVGGGWKTMEVLVAEFDMSEIKYIGQMSSSQNSRVIDPEGIYYAVINGEVELSRHDMTQLEPREDGVSNTITSVQKDNLLAEPIRIPQGTKKGYIEVPPGSLFDMSYPESTTRRGRVQEGGKVSPTLMASGEAPCHYEGKLEQSYRIRKLTPKECFRLMGVSEGDIEKIQNSGVSQSQQYKMAGNSIVVDVLEHIFRKMFVDTNQESQQLSLF